MEYRQLGRTGVKVSPLCLGTMNFGDITSEEESINIIHAAIDAGINFIDTADIYTYGTSERIVGRALNQGHRRDAIILATKCFNPMSDEINDRGVSRHHIIHACEASLRRLKTDYIDIYQMHRSDPHVPSDETLSALTDLVRQGKVRYIGCSTYPTWKVMEAILISEFKGYARYVTEQPPYNLLDRRIENELVPLALEYNLALIPYAPLASGVLAGRYPLDEALPQGSRAKRKPKFYSDRVTRKGIQIAAKLAEIGSNRGMTAAQLATLWVKDQPGITSPIIGPRTMGHLEQAIPVMDMSLSDDDRHLMDELNPPGGVVSDFFNASGWMKTKIPGSTLKDGDR